MVIPRLPFLLFCFVVVVIVVVIVVIRLVRSNVKPKLCQRERERAERGLARFVSSTYSTYTYERQREVPGDRITTQKGWNPERRPFQ